MIYDLSGLPVKSSDPLSIIIRALCFCSFTVYLVVVHVGAGVGVWWVVGGWWVVVGGWWVVGGGVGGVGGLIDCGVVVVVVVVE